MDNKSVKEQIKRKRKEKGLTQQAVADSLGLAYSTYWEIETGQTTVVNDRLADIAQIMGCSVIDLIYDRADAPADGTLEEEQAAYGDRQNGDASEKCRKRIAAVIDEKDGEIARLRRELERSDEMVTLLKRHLQDKEIIISMKDRQIKALQTDGGEEV